MRRRDEQGQVTLLIIGFASILLMAIVVVIDASAAYLQRQGLDNLADGAALYGADLGSAGIYEQGLDGERLTQQEAAVEAAVRDYLARADAGSPLPRHRRRRPRRPGRPLRHGPARARRSTCRSPSPARPAARRSARAAPPR